jgi:hypothetical protein
MPTGPDDVRVREQSRSGCKSERCRILNFTPAIFLHAPSTNIGAPTQVLGGLRRDPPAPPIMKGAWESVRRASLAQHNHSGFTSSVCAVLTKSCTERVSNLCGRATHRTDPDANCAHCHGRAGSSSQSGLIQRTKSTNGGVNRACSKVPWLLRDAIATAIAKSEPLPRLPHLWQVAR